jgi:PEP-CTERM motif
MIMNRITRTALKTLLATGTALTLGSPAMAATITGLFNTGTDASNVALVGGNGVIDPHYQIVSSTSPGFAGQQAVTFQCCYAAEDGDSRWIALSGNGSPGSNTTVYRTTFDLTGFNAATANLSGRWGADNFGTIFLNGSNTGITVSNFSFLTAFNIASGFVSGINTLDFQIQDFGPPTAFRIDDLAGTADLMGGGGVPEPASWALMIAGFGLVGGAMRRRGTVRAVLA